MALSKERVTDRIEITEDGTVHIREAIYIVEDGVRLGLLGYQRDTKRPGEDVAQKSERIKAVAAAVWTPDVIQAERDKLVEPVEDVRVR